MKEFELITTEIFDGLVEQYGITGISDEDITDELNRHEETKNENGKILDWDYENGTLSICLEGESLEELITDIANNSDSEMFKYVALDVIDCYSDDNDIECHIKDILNHGCISGTVSSMIYYNDTRKFFEKHYDEIFELLEEYKYECGDIHFELNFNNLAWFGYEECVRQLANELEIEW